MGTPEREGAEKEQKNIQRNKFQNLVKTLLYTSMRVNKLQEESRQTDLYSDTHIIVKILKAKHTEKS